MTGVKITPNIVQKGPLVGAIRQAKPIGGECAGAFVCKKVLPELGSRGLSPVYFHPSFKTSFTGGASHIKEFSDLMDVFNKNPKKMTSELALKMEDLFSKVLESNHNEAFFIGGGTFGDVYRINDKYVFKTVKNIEVEKKGFTLAEEKIGKGLNQWFGGIKAQIGNISILENADPKGTAVVGGVPMFVMGKEKIEQHYFNVFFPRAVSMPQKAFDKLAMDFKKLNSAPPASEGRYYSFDIRNLNNFLLLESDEIRTVDELRPIGDENPNNLISMLKVFLTRYRNNSPITFDEKVVPQRKNILKKCILANEKAELPIAFSSAEQSIVDFALHLAGAKPKGAELLEKLEFLRENIPDLGERMNAVEEYLSAEGI